jgi:hypothetical protein
MDRQDYSKLIGGCLALSLGGGAMAAAASSDDGLELLVDPAFHALASLFWFQFAVTYVLTKWYRRR